MTEQTTRTQGFEPVTNKELRIMAKDFLQTIWLFRLSKPDTKTMLRYAQEELETAKWPEFTK